MNGFLIYAGKRFLQFLFVVVTGITLAFLIAHFSPVDPVEQTVSLLTSFGSTDPQSVEILRESLRELYGTGGPLIDQYFTFWGRVLTGDFGPSLSSFPTLVMTVPCSICIHLWAAWVTHKHPFMFTILWRRLRYALKGSRIGRHHV